jgi:glucokinase
MTTIPNEYAIGVDIGGTNTKCGIVNRRGEVLQYEKLSTPDYETPEEFVNALCVRAHLMIDKVGGVDHIKGIGVGAPNGNIPEQLSTHPIFVGKVLFRLPI